MVKRKIYICFLGIDGSGKTSCALALHNLLKSKVKNCAYIHHDHSLIDYLPKTLKAGMRNYAAEVSLSIKDNQKCYYKDKANAIAAYLFTLAIILNSKFSLWKELKHYKNSKIIIYDRYFYDNLVHYYHLIPGWLKIITLWLIPRPDLLLYLNVSPKIALERKKEDHLDFYIWQKELLDYFLTHSKINNLYNIDANRSFEEIMSDILHIISKIII